MDVYLSSEFRLSFRRTVRAMHKRLPIYRWLAGSVEPLYGSYLTLSSNIFRIAHWALRIGRYALLPRCFGKLLQNLASRIDRDSGQFSVAAIARSGPLGIESQLNAFVGLVRSGLPCPLT
jgi:hypothetical protein